MIFDRGTVSGRIKDMVVSPFYEGDRLIWVKAKVLRVHLFSLAKAKRA